MRRYTAGPRLYFLYLLGLVFLIHSPGCDRRDSTSSEDESRTAKWVFGFSAPTLSHGWQILNRKYLVEACEELGVGLIVTDARGDDEKQISDVQSLIQRGVDGLILDPNVAALGLRMIEDARKAGIPVVFIDREPTVDPTQWNNYVSFVGPDSAEGGYRIAKHLLAKEGSKNIVAVTGLPGSAPAEERERGLRKALSEHPDVKLLGLQPGNWEMDKGMAVTQDLLGAHPAAEGIWAANDMMALGALAAVEQARKAKVVKIVSIDADPEAVRRMLENQNLVLTCGAHYICGAIGAAVLFDHLKGFDLPKRIEFRMLCVERNDALRFLQMHERGTLLKGKIRKLTKHFNPNAPDDRFSKLLEMDQDSPRP